MAESTQITNPIEIKDNSKERVAFDLMKEIAFHEREKKEGNRKDRKYWLTLYYQCREVTSGRLPEDLKEK